MRFKYGPSGNCNIWNEKIIRKYLILLLFYVIICIVCTIMRCTAHICRIFQTPIYRFIAPYTLLFVCILEKQKKKNKMRLMEDLNYGNHG